MYVGLYTHSNVFHRMDGWLRFNGILSTQVAAMPRERLPQRDVPNPITHRAYTAVVLRT